MMLTQLRKADEPPSPHPGLQGLPPADRRILMAIDAIKQHHTGHTATGAVTVKVPRFGQITF
jgi:hypothetical protein